MSAIGPDNVIELGEVARGIVGIGTQGRAGLLGEPDVFVPFAQSSRTLAGKPFFLQPGHDRVIPQGIVVREKVAQHFGDEGFSDFCAI